VLEIKIFSATDNSLSMPPEYYDRKIKIQINWRFWFKMKEHVV